MFPNSFLVVIAEASITNTINYYCSNNVKFFGITKHKKRWFSTIFILKIIDIEEIYHMLHNALAESNKYLVSFRIILIYISHICFVLVERVTAVTLSDLLRLSGTTLRCRNQAITCAPSPLLSNSAFFHNYPLKHSVGILDAWRWSTLEYCIAGRPLP